ncbi:hypothetical protein [Kitasatospora purpeofusca]|uniref:hypothetical protein n=1 Tax=Kitasatospora purpeofusca TaxID=67352 RepID=UPI0037FA9692
MQHRPLIASVAAAIGSTALILADAPWWLTGGAMGCFALGPLVVALQSVFPQESAHRLAWWRALWRHRQLARTTRPHTERHTQENLTTTAEPADDTPAHAHHDR